MQYKVYLYMSRRADVNEKIAHPLPLGDRWLPGLDRLAGAGVVIVYINACIYLHKYEALPTGGDSGSGGP